jgi:hypothetical protein
MEAPKITVQVVWTITVVGAATIFSALYDWQTHGFVGALALALGFVGFAFGAVAAATPAARRLAALHCDVLCSAGCASGYWAQAFGPSSGWLSPANARTRPAVAGAAP